MLKAIITVLDENDKILQANRLIFESSCKPIPFGTEHEFHFNIVTADDDLIDKFYESLDIEPPSLDEINKHIKIAEMKK